jgi:GDPmannose 4,6-dehydratase
VTYAMVLGCNGQDGSFLSRRLLDAGVGTVVGVGIEPQQRFDYDPTRFKYISLDLAGESAPLRALLRETRPQRIFHVAAVHASAESTQYEPVFETMLSVNVRTVHTILEHLRNEDGLARLVYASSAKVFGSPLPEVISENTPRMSTCLYGITKNAAGDLIRHYRSAHRVAASQLYLFNHESELRPQGFFIPKLVRCLKAAAHGEHCAERFHTLDFYCDWGSADEYMGIMIELLERAPAEDFVVATGTAVHARTLAARLFAKLGVPMQSHTNETVERNEARPYAVDTSKLQSVGLAPNVTIEELIERLAFESDS